MIDEQFWACKKNVALTRDGDNASMLVTEGDVTSVKTDMADSIGARYNNLEKILAL